MNIKNGLIAGVVSLGMIITGCTAKESPKETTEIPQDEPKVEQLVENTSNNVLSTIEEPIESHNIEDDLSENGKKKLELSLQLVDLSNNGEIFYFSDYVDYYNKKDFDKCFDKYQKFVEMQGNGEQLTEEQTEEFKKIKDVIEFYSNPENKEMVKNMIENGKAFEKLVAETERKMAKIKVSKEDQEIIDKLVTALEMNYEISSSRF